MSALVPESLRFAKSLYFSDKMMTKIKLILGEEDGRLFGELFFFLWFSMEHALIQSVSGLMLGGFSVHA